MALAYSFHISSKKNAINNKSDLKRVNNHNTRTFSKEKETNNQMNLELSHYNEIIKGDENLYQNVKDFYNDYFEESRIKYNEKQKRDDRKILDYFEKISSDSKKQLAVEIIIQLGDKEFWKNKNIDKKKQMTKVFKNQVNFLEKELKDFKICNAIIHYDEASPHIQIVGVPVVENSKQGMTSQVSKKSVFTKEVLKNLQNSMRKNAIENFNKIYKTKEVLKIKEKGRNKDYLIEEYKEIAARKEELQNIKTELKSLELEKKIEEKKVNEKIEEKNKLNHIETNLDLSIQNLLREIEEKEKKKQENARKKLELEKEIESQDNDILKFLEDKKNITEDVDKIFENVKDNYLKSMQKMNILELNQIFNFYKNKVISIQDDKIEYIGKVKKECNNLIELVKERDSDFMGKNYKFSLDECNKIINVLSVVNKEILGTKEILEENKNLKKELWEYRKTDNFENDMKINFEKTKLKTENSDLKFELNKINNTLNKIFEVSPELKNTFEKTKETLYPEEKWKKQLKIKKKSKERDGNER